MHMLNSTWSSFDSNSFDGFHRIYSTFLTFLFLEGKNNSMKVRKARKIMFAFSTSGREQCPCSGLFDICHRYHDTCPSTMENSSRRRRPQRNFADESPPSRHWSTRRRKTNCKGRNLSMPLWRAFCRAVVGPFPHVDDV